MTAKTHNARHVEPQKLASGVHVADVLARLAAHAHVARIRTRGYVRSRDERKHLAMLGIPLAVVAALLSEQPWMVLPLTACAWWWAPRDWGWEWLVAIGRGVIATEWAALGSSALATWPRQRALVATVWIAPVAMLLLAAAIRRGWLLP